MTRLEIEAWALTTINAITGGAPHEDSKVECKSVWPDDAKRAARQLAAHANAAGGEHILWIIGVDKLPRGVVGASHEELSNWWSSVQSEFNELAPVLETDLVIPIEEKLVVALLFRTDGAPYVVKAGGGLLEVPWREGTRTNSARRSDLIRLLAPSARLPDLEMMGAQFRCKEEEFWTEVTGKERVKDKRYRLEVSFSLYILPKDERRIVFPAHRAHCSATLEKIDYQFVGVQFFLPTNPNWRTELLSGITNPKKEQDSLTIRFSGSDLIVDGPGRFRIRANGYAKEFPKEFPTALKLHATLMPAGSKVGVSISARVSQAVEDADGGKLWVATSADKVG